MTAKRLTPIKAIRQKCLDCCCYQNLEVRLCTAVKCPLFSYRMGKRPQTKPFSEYAKKSLDLPILDSEKSPINLNDEVKE